MVLAVSRTIHLDAGEEKVEDIHLKVEDEVSGRVSVVSDSDDGINFYVEDPNGNVIVLYENASIEDFRFKASKEGNHKLHFDNTFSTNPKTVTFNYEVRHYIFGIPQEDFLVLVVMIVALIGILLFVALSRP
jgi:predicted RND superfamily exporter protein